MGAVVALGVVVGDGLGAIVVVFFVAGVADGTGVSTVAFVGAMVGLLTGCFFFSNAADTERSNIRNIHGRLRIAIVGICFG